MNLFEQIQADMKQAMKDKDSATLSVLRGIYSDLKNSMIELKRDMEDEDVVAAIRSDIKKLKDALGDFQKAAREDLVKKTKEEIEILKTYLPPEMSDEDLRELVNKKVTELGAEDMKMMGQVMGAVMADLKGKVEGSRVKKMVEEVLK